MAEVSMNREIIAKRSAFGESMLSENVEPFSQPLIEQMIENDLLSSKLGINSVRPDMSEAGAASLMKEFSRWRQSTLNL